MRSLFTAKRTLMAAFLLMITATSLLRADPPRSVTFTYDYLGRLASGQLSDGKNIDYRYDPAGNRTTVTSGTLPELAIANASSVTEGNNLSFPVTRTGFSAENITVSCIPQNGTAIGGSSAPQDDFVTSAQTIIFLSTDPSPTTKPCLIATKTDSYYEGTQALTATLQLPSAGAVIAPASGSASGSILDGNTSPRFSVAGSSATEGSSLAFTITKTGLTELSHSITYATANGTATVADGDYTATGASATFTTIQTSTSISVSTTSDTKYESNETLALNLSSATNGAGINVSSANGTINDNDTAPSIVINNPTTVNEGGTVRFTVQNTGNTSTAFTHSISWNTVDGTALSGSDYNAASGTITFAAGEASKNIDVTTRTDGTYEGTNETFFVNLTTNGSSNGAGISDNQGIGTIADIDNPIPSVPTNIRKSPTGTQPTYSIVWDASTGPVSTYILEEGQASASGGFPFSYTINAPATLKSFTNKPTGTGTYYYRVKACGPTGFCSAPTNVISKRVCNPTCID